MTAGTKLMFIYLDIIHYQILGDTKAPLLRVIDTNRRVKKGNVCPIEPNHRKDFSNLDYKKLLVNNIQSIGVNLRNWSSCPICGWRRKSCSNLKISKILVLVLNMNAYYHNQATMSHFSGHYRQRGSGFGALAMGIGRVALPLDRKFMILAAKRIGKELLVQAAPELINIATKKKTPKQALKSTVKNTITKQVGSGKKSARKIKKRKTSVK